MKIKSESAKCKICENIKSWWKRLISGEPIAFLILTVVLAIGVLSHISIRDNKIIQLKEAKFQKIKSTTPILKCGNEKQITSNNYKIILENNTPIIKVYYSDVKIETYSIDECSIITEIFNSSLGKDNVKFINTELEKRNKKLKSITISLKKQIEELTLLNKSIKRDYNLPTYKELNIYMNKYMITKKDDIKLYLQTLKDKELERLATARAETKKYKSSDECLDDSEFDMTDTRIYTLWLAGKCNEIRWIIRNEKYESKNKFNPYPKKSKTQSKYLKPYEEDPDAYIVHHNNQGGTWYEKK